MFIGHAEVGHTPQHSSDKDFISLEQRDRHNSRRNYSETIIRTRLDACGTIAKRRCKQTRELEEGELEERGEKKKKKRTKA